MNKKAFGILAGVLGIVTVVFIALGFMFNKPDNKKQEGLTELFDVSVDGLLAAVKYDKGKAGIYLSGANAEPVVQLPVEQTIMDISFSEDGHVIAYIVSDKELNASSGSSIHLFELRTATDQVVLSADSIITELAFDPKNPDKLIYLQADVFTNYSPITGARPHDFDVHGYDLTSGEQTRYTEMQKYSMQSLQVSATDESVYIQMNDDEDAKSADDLFASYQRIFKIPLHAPNEKEIISNPASEEDIYDFLVLPDRDEMIYQAVGGTSSSGTFEYELFSYNWESDETVQLTNLKEYAAKPVLGKDGKIYFLVDLKFAKRNPEYRIYKMDLDGKNIVEVLQ